MAEFPAMPLWTDAYLGDTTHLTTIEHGAYFLLLMTMWRSKDGSLPNDDKMLARFTKLTPAQWKRIKPIILEFFDEKNGALFQSRLTAVRVAVEQKKKQASQAGKVSALKRKETTSTDVPTDVPTDASTEGQQKANLTKTKTIKEKNIKKEIDPPDRNEFVQKTKITQSFCPDQESRSYAENLNLDTGEQQRKFINHYAGNGQLRADWQATFRSWCDKAAEFSKSDTGHSDTQTNALYTDQRTEYWKGLMHAFQNKGLWFERHGPKPGTSGCRVPAEILKEFGIEQNNEPELRN